MGQPVVPNFLNKKTSVIFLSVDKTSTAHICCIVCRVHFHNVNVVGGVTSVRCHTMSIIICLRSIYAYFLGYKQNKTSSGDRNNNNRQELKPVRYIYIYVHMGKNGGNIYIHVRETIFYNRLMVDRLVTV